jgi:hypothetical protein
MPKVFVAILVSLLLLLASTPSPAINRQGDMSFGGSIAFEFVSDDYRESHSTFIFTPSFGIFIFNQFELLISANVVDDLDTDYTMAGFFFGCRGVFSTGTRFMPFVGFEIGPMVLHDGGSADYVGMAIPAGFLIAINQFVAISISSLPQLYFGVDENRQTLIYVPVGLLGVEGYF